MSKLSSMTIGLVLIFIGVQLTLVNSYVLTPTAMRFLKEDLNTSNRSSVFVNQGQNKSEGLFSGIFRSSGNQKNNSISSAPAGQSWPYYRADNANASNTGNSSLTTPSFQNSSWQSSSYQSGSNTGWGTSQVWVPPRWVAWPPLFLGLVFFLHGLALRR